MNTYLRTEQSFKENLYYHTVYTSTPVSESLKPAAQHCFNAPYSITEANELNQC